MDPVAVLSDLGMVVPNTTERAMYLSGCVPEITLSRRVKTLTPRAASMPSSVV